jgi:hypothetical protein
MVLKFGLIGAALLASVSYASAQTNYDLQASSRTSRHPVTDARASSGTMVEGRSAATDDGFRNERAETPYVRGNAALDGIGH